MMTPHSGWNTYRVKADSGSPGLSVHELRGSRPGPSVLILGGVHGDEVGGIVAARQLVSTLDAIPAGRIRVVVVTNEAAFEAQTRENPEDGADLARSLPGEVDGTPTQRLAALVGERLIKGSDLLIDLHTSGPAVDMPLFVGALDDGSEIAMAGVELALASGFETVWTHPTLSRGRTVTFAYDVDVPSLYFESPVGGVLHQPYLEGYVTAVKRILTSLAMLPPVADAEGREVGTWLHGNGDTDLDDGFSFSPRPGLFLTNAEVLDEVTEGDTVGWIIDPYGHDETQVVAPMSGFVVALRRHAFVVAGSLILGIAPARPVHLGFPSDSYASGLNLS